MIASCNYIEIVLFNRSNSFRINENIPSADSNVDIRCCCLPTPMTLASGESNVPACGIPASSAVTPAWSVHKSRGDKVVRMWVQLKR